MLHNHHRQRGRSLFIHERVRIRALFFVAALLLSFLGIREAHDESASSRSSSHDASSAAANSYLLLCLTDGSIHSVQAWTGEYESSIVTDPLLQTHRTAASTDMVLPGLDGRLYWRPPSPHPDDESGAPPVQQQPLQELPLTVHALLENPVRSCDPTESSSGSKSSSTLEDCGILTAEAVTSLLALTEKGKLLWKTHGGGRSDTPTEAEASGRNNILLLQRKDYWVQHVLASTGQQSWNVSLGTYEALDFGLPTEEDTLLLDNDDDILNDRDDHHGEQQLLPAVVFSNQGRTVTAIDPVHSTVLWRQHVPSTLSAVFGISDGQWKTVPVVTASEFMEELQQHDTERPMLPSFSQEQQQRNELERFLWTQNQKQWAGNQHQQPYPFPLGLPGSKAEESNKNRKDVQRQGTKQMSGNENDNDNCLVNGAIVEGTCPNLYAPPHLLHLPSPTAPVVTKATPVSVASDGLLLSWSLVTVLVIVFVVTVAGGRFWYVRKKNKWLTDLGQSRPSIDESHDVSTSFSIRVGHSHEQNQQHQHNLRRSSSLPGAFGSPDPLRDFSQPTVLSPPIVGHNSDNGKQLLWGPPQLPTLPGGTTIPLVRYSRYASEFIELRALGRGGFGSVFQCKNALDGRDYAIKKVSIRSSNSGSTSDRETVFQQQLERVLREVKILAVLDHPNIVRYYTAWLEIDAGDTAAAESETASLSTHHLKNQSRAAHEYDDEQSRCYSSSLLLDTDSVSGWGVASQNGGNHVKRNNSNRHQYMTKANDPLGWNNTGFDMESDSSKSASSSMFATKRRSFNLTSFDNLIVFAEESIEDKSDVSIPNTKSKVEELLSSNLENTNPLLPRRRSFSLGQPSDALFSHSKTTVLPNVSCLPADTMAQENGSSAGFSLRHTLYIQMQLCSHKTVAEFLADREARCGPDSTTQTGVDIPKALRLFLQIAEAVKHVHSQSLIHRDLKPSNCFMDDSGSTVKVGDFGLSRESTFLSDGDVLDIDKGESIDAGRTKPKIKSISTPACGGDDHTAGVGTRSYASPEQLNGSAYDASTDVYSLGIMLFELLYPMYTGMERNICLSRLHNNVFPNDWEETIGKAFPTMRGLIVDMLSIHPSARPTAESVARHIQAVMGEFTILSLDTEHYFNNHPDVVLLRVEAEHRDNTLPHTMQLIRDESAATHGCPVEIVQYGLRSTNSSSDNNHGPATAIMEFALKFQDSAVAASESSNALRPPAAAQLVNNLRLHPEILKARHVAGRRVSESMPTHN